MTTQAFTKEFNSKKEQIDEAKELIKNLNFIEKYSCCDGYESWESSRQNMDAFVELIRRARSTVGVIK